MLAIHNKLQEAWETSTKNDNRFAIAIGSIKWDDMFSCDDVYYFILGDYMLEVPDMDPFGTNADYAPISYFGNTCVIGFDGASFEL